MISTRIVTPSLTFSFPGEDCPDNGCPRQSSFPNFGSYAFNEAYITSDRSGVEGRVVAGGLVLATALVTLLI